MLAVAVTGRLIAVLGRFRAVGCCRLPVVLCCGAVLGGKLAVHLGCSPVEGVPQPVIHVRLKSRGHGSKRLDEVGTVSGRGVAVLAAQDSVDCRLRSVFVVGEELGSRGRGFIAFPGRSVALLCAQIAPVSAFEQRRDQVFHACSLATPQQQLAVTPVGLPVTPVGLPVTPVGLAVTPVGLAVAPVGLSIPFSRGLVAPQGCGVARVSRTVAFVRGSVSLAGCYVATSGLGAPRIPRRHRTVATARGRAVAFIRDAVALIGDTLTPIGVAVAFVSHPRPFPHSIPLRVGRG